MILILYWVEGKVPRILNLALQKEVSRQGMRYNPRLTFDGQKTIRLAKLFPFFAKAPLPPGTQFWNLCSLLTATTVSRLWEVAFSPGAKLPAKERLPQGWEFRHHPGGGESSRDWGGWPH